jgi:hypothetical protein
MEAIGNSVPPEKRPTLIAAWAIAIAESARACERIRAQVKARPDGFFRHRGEARGMRGATR